MIAPDAILCRYSEIALKGSNRGHFEQLLVQSLNHRAANALRLLVRREHSRVMIRHRHNYEAFTDDELAVLHEQLPRVFGLDSWSPGRRVPPCLDEIESAAEECLELAYNHQIETTADGPITFRTRVRRDATAFDLPSRDVEIHLADSWLSRYDRLKVDLSDDAAITIHVEIRRNWAFVYEESYPGPGGLPGGSSDPCLCLLSGGIDSPVAAWLTMKRGSYVDFVTFHSDPYTPPTSLDKVARLTRILNRWQKPGRLFAVNLLEAQKAVRDTCHERFRTVLYRRLMMRVAGALATDIGAGALVTGESVGQVASQTIRNLNVINAAADRLVLRPLGGWDKNEAVACARRIGTFEVSKIQVPDSCTVFAPTQPTTSAPLKLIEEDEAAIDAPALVAMTLADHVEQVNLQTGRRYPHRLGGSTPA